MYSIGFEGIYFDGKLVLTKFAVEKTWLPLPNPALWQDQISIKDLVMRVTAYWHEQSKTY